MDWKRPPRYPLRVKLAVFFCATALSGMFAFAQQPAPAYTSDPAFVKQRADAIRLSHDRSNANFVADAWNKANKLAGGKCIECYQGAIDGNLKIGDWKKAADVARQWDSAATSDSEHCLAQVALGRTLLQGGSGKKPNVPVLEEAHAALVKAESMSSAAWFYDGQVLSELRRENEASAAFKSYTQKTRSNDPLMLRAQHFVLHPELAREQMVPAVVVTTLAGKKFNLDEMNGKVVLIDFWATWCGPCNKELPHIKKLAETFANEPFEIISVSWDSDETKWKEFIAQNGMTWNQYRDVNMALGNAFGIHEIPHYFTIDSNGVLTAENIGSGSNIDSRIKKLIQQAKQDRERMMETTATVSSGAH